MFPLGNKILKYLAIAVGFIGALIAALIYAKRSGKTEGSLEEKVEFEKQKADVIDQMAVDQIRKNEASVNLKVEKIKNANDISKDTASTPNAINRERLRNKWTRAN